MGFGEAIKTCFSKYATFSGRARRSEFWWWVVFVIIVSIIANILDSLFGTRYVFGETASGSTYVGTYSTGYITSIAYLVLLLPGISVAVRRLHDTGKSGWWWWLNVICCVGTIILIVFYAQDSTPDNQYGPNPNGVPPGGLPPAPA